MKFLNPASSFKKGKAKEIVVVLVLLIFAIVIVGSLIDSKVPSSSSPGTVPSIAAWNNRYSTQLATLSSDAARVHDDSTKNVSALNNDCYQLETALVKARSNLPAIPNGSIEQHWQQAVTLFNSGTRYCMQGTSDTFDVHLVTQGTDKIGQANAELSDVTSAIQEAVGQH